MKRTVSNFYNRTPFTALPELLSILTVKVTPGPLAGFDWWSPIIKTTTATAKTTIIAAAKSAVQPSLLEIVIFSGISITSLVFIYKTGTCFNTVYSILSYKKQICTPEVSQRLLEAVGNLSGFNVRASDFICQKSFNLIKMHEARDIVRFLISQNISEFHGIIVDVTNNIP